MKRPEDAFNAIKDPNPIIDGRKANVNLAVIGAKPRSIPGSDTMSQPLTAAHLQALAMARLQGLLPNSSPSGGLHPSMTGNAATANAFAAYQPWMAHAGMMALGPQNAANLQNGGGNSVGANSGAAQNANFGFDYAVAAAASQYPYSAAAAAYPSALSEMAAAQYQLAQAYLQPQYYFQQPLVGSAGGNNGAAVAATVNPANGTQ